VRPKGKPPLKQKCDAHLSVIEGDAEQPDASTGTNILEDLFSQCRTTDGSDLEGLTDLVYGRSRETAAPSEASNVTDFPQRKIPVDSNKKKLSYYLSQQVHVELCEAKAKIRVMVPPGLKSKVSMSRIVDYAVNAIIQELKTAGEDSELVKKFLNSDSK
jgi:hypothetical protein